ncbi:MAG: hypothetical protein HPY53_01540 [Brevinematales bacterium]|nr:hypothetical protein [Brevinematales bacterium]
MIMTVTNIQRILLDNGNEIALQDGQKFYETKKMYHILDTSKNFRKIAGLKKSSVAMIFE